jgi:GT2 family glycosyltransferase
MPGVAYVIPFVRQTPLLAIVIGQLQAESEAHAVLIHDPEPGKADGEDAPTADEAAVTVRDERLTILRNRSNSGYTRSVNRAVRWALDHLDCPFLWVVNDDVAFVRGVPSAPTQLPARAGLLGVLSNRAGYQSVAYSLDEMGDYLYPDCDVTAATLAFDDLKSRAGARLVPVPLVHGFCFGASRECLEAVGLLDEIAFRSGYGSDYDISLRAARCGFTNFVYTGAFVWHAGTASAGRVHRRLCIIGADLELRRLYGENFKRAKFVTRQRLDRRMANFTPLSR